MDGKNAILPRSCIFPPELVPLLRARLSPEHPCLAGITDESLAELLTVVFFAGFATEEGKRYAIRVAFVGADRRDVVLPDGDGAGVGPTLIYRWRAIAFETARALAVATLVKLSVVSRSERVYTKVGVVDGALVVLGLAREGVSGEEDDPYLKLVVSAAGRMSIYAGREHMLDYDGGEASSPSTLGVLSAGPVHRSLEKEALAAGLPAARVGQYMDAVHALVQEMRAHGKGGILIVCASDSTEPPAQTVYRTRCEPSLVALLRNLTPDPSAPPSSRGIPPARGSQTNVGLRRVLHAVFASEVERYIADVGACTAMDGATLLDCELRMIAFGAILPVVGDLVVEEGFASEGPGAFDLSARGARHRAAASYAHRHPGSVVFVASEDGPVHCLFRDLDGSAVAMWRFGHVTSGQTTG